eukprot:UN32620
MGTGIYKNLTIFKTVLASDDLRLLRFLMEHGLDVNTPCKHQYDLGRRQGVQVEEDKPMTDYAQPLCWGYLLFTNSIKIGIRLPILNQGWGYHDTLKTEHTWNTDKITSLNNYIDAIGHFEVPFSVKKTVLSMLFNESLMFLQPNQKIQD